jgi:hypothetical protein
LQNQYIDIETVEWKSISMSKRAAHGIYKSKQGLNHGRARLLASHAHAIWAAIATPCALLRFA